MEMEMNSVKKLSVFLLSFAMLTLTGISAPAAANARSGSVYYVATHASRSASGVAGGSCSRPGWIGSDDVAIQGALDAANDADPLDTVFICAGTYAIDAMLMVDVPIVLKGASASRTILDGGSVRLIRSNNPITITRLKLMDGFSDGGDGGAVYSSGDVLVDHVDFSANRADDRGGAIYSLGLVTATYSTFTSNTALDSDGGAIFAHGSVTVAGSKFNNNAAADDGGAIRSESDVSLNMSKFVDNAAQGNDGGAVYADGDVFTSRSDFTNNEADEDGGAVRAERTMLIAKSSFSGNIAGNSGGALYGDGDLNIAGSKFTNNSATGNNGGAVRGESDVTVANSTFNGNFATDGGALDAGDSVAIVTKSTFAGNYTTGTSDGSGGAINAETLSVTKSTFKYNYTDGVDGDGGAISFAFLGDGGLTSNQFTHNTAGGDGGAIVQWCGAEVSESDYTNVNRFSHNVGDLYSDVMIIDESCD